MAIIQFEDGTRVNFNGTPTQQDVEEVSRQLGLRPAIVAAQQKPQQKRNAVQKTAGFLGVEKAGQGLATAGREASGSVKQTGEQEAELLLQQAEIMKRYAPGSPERKRAMDQLKRTTAGGVTQQSEIDPGTTLSNKEVLGSFGNVALNVVGAGQVAGKAAATGALSKGGAPLLGSSAKTVGRRIASATAKNTAFGAASGVAQGMNENKALSKIIEQGLISGVISGGIGFGTQGISEFGKLLTSRRTTEAVLNRSLGVSKRVTQAGKSPSKGIIERGKISSKAGYLKEAEETITDAEASIGKILKERVGSSQRYDTQAIVGEIKDRLGEVYKGALSEDEIDDIIKNLPIASLRGANGPNIMGLNNLRKIIDGQYLGNTKWLNSTSATTERVTALKIAANVLRGTVQGSHPELPGLFAKYSQAITQKTVLDEALAKPHILTNLFEAMASLGVGAFSGGGPSVEGAATALGTFAAIKTLFSTPVQAGLAIGLDRAGRLPQTRAGVVARTIGRNATQRTIQSAQ